MVPWNPSQTSMRVTHSTGNVSNVPSLYNGDPMPAGQMTMYDAAAVSNLATPVAYVHGGTNPNQSRTEKYDFSTDNRISLPGANASDYLSRHSAASSGTDGYFSSGYSPGQGYQSYMNKFTYSTETMALLPGTVQQSSGNPSWAGQEYGGSTGNKEQGYWYGGMAYSGSNITKIVYSTDTPSSLPGRMTSAQPSPVYNRGIQAGSTGVRASNRPGMIGPFPDATPTATKSPNPFPTSDKIYFSGGLTSSTAGYPPTPPAAQTISNTDKRTDYKGNEIAAKVQLTWDKNFDKKIEFVTGDEWKAGNLSYHLKSRPKWEGFTNETLLDNSSQFICVDDVCLGRY